MIEKGKPLRTNITKSQETLCLFFLAILWKRLFCQGFISEFLFLLNIVTDMKKTLFLLLLFFFWYTFSEGICSEELLQKGFTEYNGRCRASGFSLQVQQEYNKEKDENEIVFTIENKSSTSVNYIQVNNGSILDTKLFKDMGNKDEMLDPNEKIEVRESDWMNSFGWDFSFTVSIWKNNDEIITLTENVVHVQKPECENIELTTRDEEGKKMIHVVCLPENDYKLSMSELIGDGGHWVFDPKNSDNGIFDFQIHTGKYEISCARLGEFVADADNKCLKQIEISSGYESEYQQNLLQLFREAKERRFKYLTWMGIIAFCIGITFFFARNRKHFFLSILAVVVVEILLHRNNIATQSIYGFSPESLWYILVSSLVLFRLQLKTFKTEIFISIIPGALYVVIMLLPFPNCLNGSSIFHGSTNSCECVGIMKKQFYIISAAGTSNDASQCIGYAKAACYKMDLWSGSVKSCNQ